MDLKERSRCKIQQYTNLEDEAASDEPDDEVDFPDSLAWRLELLEEELPVAAEELLPLPSLLLLVLGLLEDD